MDMHFREAAETVAAAIRELAKETPGVTVLVEDKGDIVFEAQKALSKAGVTVVVTVDRFARRANSGQLLAGTLTLDVTASENVPLNRARPDAGTAQMVVEALATGLHWRAFGGRFASPLRLATFEKLYPSPKVTSVALSFAAEYMLGEDGEAEKVSWGIADGSTVYGDMTEVTDARGGENVYEEDRAGDAKWVGTRDRHWAIELTCTVRGIGKDDLPAKGATFVYGGETYVCDTASITRTVEGVATARLTGRTVKQ